MTFRRKANYRQAASIALIILIFALLAGAVYAVTELGKDRGIKMSHSKKAHGMNLECSMCHSQAPENSRLMSFPNHDNCGVCHGEAIDPASEKTDCAFCHSNADYSTILRKNMVLSPTVAFDHARHDKAGVKCAECHDPQTEPVGDALIPDMDACIACHSAKSVGRPEDCAACHTVPGFDKLKPKSHTGLWKKSHGKGLFEDTIKSEGCNYCHTLAKGNDCNSCHKRDKPDDHTLSFAKKGHVKHAQTDREKCAVCHTQSQCITCHTSNPPMSHTAFWGSTKNRHCLRCHMAGNDFAAGALESNCGTCHKAGAVYAKHLARSRTATHITNGWNTCDACHSMTSTLAPRIPHPYIENNASCLGCHP